MAPTSLLARSWPVLLLLLGAAAALWPLLALPVGFGALVALLALPKPSAAQLPGSRLWLGLAGLAVGVGLVRFVAREAVPGIVGGGQRAVEDQAISRLRDVLVAQDAMRRAAWIDPDRDGIGSAAALSELCGEPPLRGQLARETPLLLCGELVPTALGPAARAGAYLYTVCLPRAGGGWVVQPGLADAVDEEAAERRFVAVAWPAAHGPFTTAYFIDEHENIRVSPPRPAAGRPPACDEALAMPEWPAWRNKKPRPVLPGDRSPREPTGP